MRTTQLLILSLALGFTGVALGQAVTQPVPTPGTNQPVTESPQRTATPENAGAGETRPPPPPPPSIAPPPPKPMRAAPTGTK
ncbi:MAG: hypothetical protein FWC38_07795 [Proteobacteria bacterium]|nr:hypothetical protein [Pseudomonadota bacterium]